MNMNVLKTIPATVLVLGLLTVGCACGNRIDQEGMASNNGIGETAVTSYTVTVVDEDNQPVSGVLLQLCLETCIPNKTNANGIAEFVSLPDGDYKVSLLSVPDGYDYATEEREWYFADGEYTLTVVLSRVP